MCVRARSRSRCRRRERKHTHTHELLISRLRQWKTEQLYIVTTATWENSVERTPALQR